ncbi:MAG: hypothetical protein AB1762_00945 [Gemmatimonadota bacterium]
MHSFLLGTHNILRWLVLVIGVVALIRSLRGLASGSLWTRAEAASLSGYANILGLQMLVGLGLYFFTSPVGMQALGDMGTAMRDPNARFYAVEHPLAMLLAVALAHIALARTKKAATDAARFRTAALLITLSLVLVLARMPWARPMIPAF